ncbi:MAG: hypothetical protein WDA24_06985 [Tissierellales bacterium]
MNDDKEITYVLNKKGIKLILIASAFIVLAVLLFVFIKHGSITNTKMLSDYFFTVGIVLFILGALAKTIVWIANMRFVLKPRSEGDVKKPYTPLNILSKVILIIGTINTILSLVFALLYYYI